MANSITTSSTTIEGQLIEIVSKLQELESDTNANPNGENRITGTFNTDTGSFTGTFTIAGSLASNANGFSVVVTPYLTEV